MSLRLTSLAAASFLGIFAVPLFAHAAIPFFGPIIPNAQQLCPGSWYLVIVVINNIISLAITLAITIVTPIMFAYSGFLLVTNAFNPSAKEDAKKMLTNTIVGIVIALAAWMIVDALMAVLYHPTDPGLAGKTWSELITGGTGDACLKIAASLNTNKTGSGITGSTPDDAGVYVDGKSAALCSDSNTACSPAALQAAGFTATQANVMSCIAMTENSGSAAGCNSVSACGTFQIVITVNPLSGPSCAKYNGGNPTLNCKVMCKGNDGAALQTAACQPCIQAASDPACNAESAHNLYKQSGYKPWLPKSMGGYSDNQRSAACVQQYGNG